MIRRLSWSRALAALVVVFVAIQVVPYGRDHENPPVIEEPLWDSQGTRALAVRACFDCHSNETTWPVYASVAPVSWLVQHDVDEGREYLNFSEWNRPQEDAHEAGEHTRDGSMPLRPYQLAHAHARLTNQEREALATGLDRTLNSASHAEPR
jgi:hypothetical protein